MALPTTNSAAVARAADRDGQRRAFAHGEAQPGRGIHRRGAGAAVGWHGRCWRRVVGRWTGRRRRQADCVGGGVAGRWSGAGGAPVAVPGGAGRGRADGAALARRSRLVSFSRVAIGSKWSGISRGELTSTMRP